MKAIYKNLGKVCITPEGEWSRNKAYERISIVTDVVTSFSYISKKDVPTGIDISNQEYWQKISSSGFYDNDIIVLNDVDENKNLISYSLEEAINIISNDDKRPGLILSFYGSLTKDAKEVYAWNMYQFDSNTIDNWNIISYWKNILNVDIVDNLNTSDSHKALSANQGKVLKELIDNIKGFDVSIVTTLPSTGVVGIVYLIRDSSGTGDNIYNEYVWLKSTSSYEKLGSINTKIDLSNYVTNEILNNKLKDYVTNSALTSLLQSYNKTNNFKTINGNSIIGTGNITIKEGISSVPLATSNAVGGFKTGYSNNAKNYSVQLDSNGKAFVNVPWTDTNTTYEKATTTTDGLMSKEDKQLLNGLNIRIEYIQINADNVTNEDLHEIRNQLISYGYGIFTINVYLLLTTWQDTAYIIIPLSNSIYDDLRMITLSGKYIDTNGTTHYITIVLDEDYQTFVDIPERVISVDNDFANKVHDGYGHGDFAISDTTNNQYTNIGLDILNNNEYWKPEYVTLVSNNDSFRFKLKPNVSWYFNHGEEGEVIGVNYNISAIAQSSIAASFIWINVYVDASTKTTYGNFDIRNI